MDGQVVRERRDAPVVDGDGRFVKGPSVRVALKEVLLDVCLEDRDGAPSAIDGLGVTIKDLRMCRPSPEVVRLGHRCKQARMKVQEEDSYRSRATNLFRRRITTSPLVGRFNFERDDGRFYGLADDGEVFKD